MTTSKSKALDALLDAAGAALDNPQLRRKMSPVFTKVVQAECNAILFLARMTRKDLLIALRTLGETPMYASELDKGEVVQHIATRMQNATPSDVADEIGRMSDERVRAMQSGL